MENKSSKEYVVELLKQLEDLKKKKARKERKLQKLKSSAQIDQASRNSHASLNKTSNKGFNTENSAHLVDSEKSDDDSHKNESCHSFNDSKCTKTVNTAIKDDKENFSYEKLDTVEYRRNNMTTSESESPKYNESDRKGPVQTVNNNIEKNDSACKTFAENESRGAFNNSAHAKSNFLDTKKSKENFFSDKHDSSCFNNHIIHSGSIEKSHLEINEAKLNGNDIYNVQETNGNKNTIVMSVETKVVSIPTDSVTKEDSTLDNFCEKSHSSNKLLPNSKKSSDILDDSLNSNMSCFLSSELFPANDDKKRINNEDKSAVACTCEKLKQTKSHIELIASIPKMTFPVVSDPVSQKYQNNFDFNFPKFSTPTDGIVFPSSNDENVLKSSQDKSVELSISNGVRTVSYATEDVCTMNKKCNDGIQSENKFDPSEINLILEKGLFSVLDAHYESPKKPITSKDKISSNIIHEKKRCFLQEITGETACKKRKLFPNTSVACLKQQSKFGDRIRSNNSSHGSFEDLAKADKAVNTLFSDSASVASIEQQSKLVNKITSKNSFHDSFENLDKVDKPIIDVDIDFDDTDAFPSNSGSFSDLQTSFAEDITSVSNSSDDIQSQVTKTINGLVTKVCEDYLIDFEVEENMNGQSDKNKKTDSEILIVPETEGLGIYFSKDTEDFLETSALSESLKDFHVKDYTLNTSVQSKLESPVVNKIVQAIKSTKDSFVLNTEKGVKLKTGGENCDDMSKRADRKESFDNSLGMDTSFLEDDTQELGSYKQVPYLNEKNIQETQALDDSKTESNLNFICSLYGAPNEAVIDVEIVVFSGVKYAFIQHKTQIHVWRQEQKKEWIKIFNHQTEDMFSLVKICVTTDEDNLVIVMLLSDDEQYCLQFLLFEKDARVIKLMENAHWLEERHSQDDSVLLCGLNGLMFATAQVKKGHEVSLHAFISLKDCPRLMTAVLGSTDSPLCSLCKINKLPNALMGINDSMLYVWHVLEARLVTAVSLHPHDYLPINQCFWATVENGLIYLLTTCEGQDKHQVCQLLVANLATGFCQCAMTYSSQPSRSQIAKITKAVYMEPFLVASHLNGAFLWSVTEEHCCAALSSISDVTSVAISRDFENWGLIVVGSKLGYIACYSLN